MKKFSVWFVCTLFSNIIYAQSPFGAWEASSKAENGDKLSNVVIFANGYQALSIYNATTGNFIHANGGTWRLEGDTMFESVEFHTDNADRIGTEVSFKVSITDDTFQIVGSDMIFNRLDNGEPGSLQGAWIMSSKIRDGETQLLDTNSPIKTMRLLSGTRFQWIAYNTETKKFVGTGGGTYTSIDGEYIENTEYFSKDNSKAGLSLKFNYELIDDQWHHSGLSSKGDLIHEVWSVRE